MRKLICSGIPYEPKVYNSRAVRVGPIVTVAGTAPLGSDGRTLASGGFGQDDGAKELIGSDAIGSGKKRKHLSGGGPE